ncbi:NAD-dependent epimerase/dehydratase family protein [Sorangium sp. So ce448]|uniref:NAD-dependent epimerase/dehydratase family protein n=1 Tax=Sorangium sp. So ce448 TaxID=3133314 RepID=UPI003F5FAB73
MGETTGTAVGIMQNYKDRRILVTGGAGAIGGSLTAALADAGAEVIVVDDLSSSSRWGVPARRNVRFVEGSVVDDGVLAAVFRERPSHVFHLAALFANQNSVDNPERDLEVNGLGTLRVLQHARRSGAQRVVFASSGCAPYGSDPPRPVHEDHLALDVHTPYQATKLLGELYCNYFCAHPAGHDGLSTVRIRPFNSYGPGEVPGRYRNVIPNFVYWALRGEPLPITGTGEETRSFTYVGDIVDGFLRAGTAAAASGEAFNLASGEEIAILDVAKAINEMTGNRAGVRFVGRRAWDTQRRRVASTDKARRVLGFEAQTGLREGLARTVAWFRERWAQIEAEARF